MTTTSDLSNCKMALYVFMLAPFVINLRRLVQADPELAKVIQLPPDSDERGWGGDNALTYSSGLFRVRGVTALFNRGYFSADSATDKQNPPAWETTLLTWKCVLDHDGTDADVLETLAFLVDHGILPTGESYDPCDLMVTAIDQGRGIEVCAFLFDHGVKLSEEAWNSAINRDWTGDANGYTDCAACTKCMQFFLDRGFVPTPSNTWWSMPRTDGLLCANRFRKIQSVLGFPLPTLVELSTEMNSIFDLTELRFGADGIEFFEESYHISRSSMTFDDCNTTDYVCWLMPSVYSRKTEPAGGPL